MNPSMPDEARGEFPSMVILSGCVDHTYFSNFNQCLGLDHIARQLVIAYTAE